MINSRDNNIGQEMNNRVTYRGLLNLSSEYIKSYETLSKDQPRLTDLFHVKFYLLAHSIELAFKAYLRFKGLDVNQLKKLSHNLIDIYNLLSTRYVYRLDKKVILIIESVNIYYSTKQFEYPLIGSKSVPEIKELHTIANLINNSTRIQIEEESKLV